MNAVTDAIMQVTNDAHVRLAMLVGSYMEGGWNPSAVGDGGTSFGSFQIHLPAHPGVTAQEAEDPTFAAKYMLGAYQNGASQVSASLWSTNPALAAATAAYYAERPLNMYASSSYNAAYAATTKVLGGASLGPSSGGDSGVGETGVTAQNASFLGFDINSVLKPLQSLMNYGYVFVLIGGGVVVMGLGMYWMFKGSGLGISVPVVNVTVPSVGNVRRYESKSKPGPTQSSGAAGRYANASRARTPSTVAGRVVEGPARTRTAVPAQPKRAIERG